MEAAHEASAWQQPDFSAVIDPSERKQVIKLDRHDPIDGLVLAYKEAVRGEYLDYAPGAAAPPPPAQQRVLIAGFNSGNLDATRQLADSHMGLVAAVAFPFKGGRLNSEELLETGRHVLLHSAKTYDSNEGDFGDHAARAIHAALQAQQPELAAGSYITAEQPPMESIYRFLEAARPGRAKKLVAKPEPEGPMHGPKTAAEVLQEAKLDESEMGVLQNLHLRTDGIMAATGLSKNQVHVQRAAVSTKLGVRNLEEAALTGMAAGIEYDIRKIPPRKDFSLQERQVAMRRYLPNKQVAEELGLAGFRLTTIMKALWKKTQARSEPEMLLMAHIGKFEPTEAELNPPEPTFEERLTPLHRRVLSRLTYKTDSEIGQMKSVGMTLGQVRRFIRNFAKETGLRTNNRTALVLDLHRNGLEFDVPEPERPLHETLYAHELEIARLLDLSSLEIIDKLQLDCKPERINEIVYDARHRVGARSREELALMVEMFDDGSPALEMDTSNNRWRLERHLGVQVLKDSTLLLLLEELTEDQLEVVEPYALSGRPVKWADVAEETGVPAVIAKDRATRAWARMRGALDAALEKTVNASIDESDEKFAAKCGFESAADENYSREVLLGFMRPKMREAVELFYFSGQKMTWEEAGKRLGISQQAAYARGRDGLDQARNGWRRAQRRLAGERSRYDYY